MTVTTNIQWHSPQLNLERGLWHVFRGYTFEITTTFLRASELNYCETNHDAPSMFALQKYWLCWYWPSYCDVWFVIGKVIVCFQLKGNWLFPNIHMILGEMHISTAVSPVRKQWKWHSLALIHHSTRHKMQYKPLRHVGIIFIRFICINKLFVLYDFASFLP